jgi:exopolyphosphatase/guanosine-5'-triphosphate,3'-diphosphate pyrophosphatase
MSLFASLDLGTNTFRLLIAEVVNVDTLVPVITRRAITRLGEGIYKNASIPAKAIERSLKVLKDFSKTINHYKADKVFAVSTSAARDAKNGKEFIYQVYKQTGIQVRILTGLEEAKLTLKGVFSVVDRAPKRSLMFDIGGGSTELILTEGNNIVKTASIRLGVVHLAENLITTDPPAARELSYLRKYINNSIVLSDFTIDNRLDKSYRANSMQFPLIGTAGTVTTLAAIDQQMEQYDPLEINNYKLTRETIENIYHRLNTLPISERRKIPGLEEGREVVIIPGTAMVLEIMDYFRFNKLIVSDAGLLEGILLDTQTTSH